MTTAVHRARAAVNTAICRLNEADKLLERAIAEIEKERDDAALALPPGGLTYEVVQNLRQIQAGQVGSRPKGGPGEFKETTEQEWVAQS